MITIFGSVGLDIVQSVRALPRPGETVLTGDYAMLPGGKGANQALAAARAGATTRFIATIGDDDFGRRALDNLDRAGVDLSNVAQGDRPTACATISVDGAGENQIVVSSGANLETKAGQLWLQPEELLLLQMEIPPDENWAAVNQAHKLGVRTVLNVAPYAAVPAEALEKLDTLILNEVEAQMLASDLNLNADDPSVACAAVHETYSLTVVLTLGAAGAVAFSGEQSLRASALDIVALDTVGAGDAFVGAYTAAIDCALPLEDCLRWGSVAGGLTCLQPGAQDGMPERAEIEARAREIKIEAV